MLSYHCFRENTKSIELLITHADGSRVSIALIRLCDSVCLSAPHDKTKTAETKITKLGTGIVHHVTSPTNEF